MEKLIVRLFAPRAIKDLIGEFEKEKKELLLTAFPREIIDSVGSKVSAKSGWKAFSSAINNEGMPPRNIVNYLMAQECYNALASGIYHIYRGTLSMQGDETLRVFLRTNQELEAAGVLSPEVAEEDRISIMSEIKSVG